MAVPTCRICLKKFQNLRFNSDRVCVCGRCTNDLNGYKEVADPSYQVARELLEKGVVRRAQAELSSDVPLRRHEEAQRTLDHLDFTVEKALPGWINKLLKDKSNRKKVFKIIRAERRGLLHRYKPHKWGYPKNWSEIAANIRRLDGFSCVSCKATDVELHVHHIVYVSNYGTHQKTNLVTLCRNCHEAEHKRVFDFGENMSSPYEIPIYEDIDNSCESTSKETLQKSVSLEKNETVKAKNPKYQGILDKAQERRANNRKPMRRQEPGEATSEKVINIFEEDQSLLTSIDAHDTIVENTNNDKYLYARNIFNRITDDGFRQNDYFSDQQQIELISTIETFQKLAKAGYGKAYYPLSIGCIRNNYKEGDSYALLSFNWCEENKSSGDIEIWNDLGNLYRRGRGNRMADRLDSLTHIINSILNFNDSDAFESALILYRKSAENNHAPAQTNLGFILHQYSGKFGISRNDEQAAYWLQKAAEQGHALAQMKLGTMYEHGHGVVRNCQHAAFWYLKAAKQGHAMAQDLLGTMYLTGNGLPQDSIEAYLWFSLSAAANNKRGEEGLSTVVRQMTPSQLTEAKLRIQQMEQHEIT